MSPAGVADAFAWPDTDTPFVRAVMVSTVDGSAQSPEGRSGGISSASDRLVFTTIRGLSDVILVGAQTVRAEGYGPVRPRPEVARRRSRRGGTAVPRIAIVTGSGDLDPGTPLFTEAEEPPILLVPESLPDERRAALEPVAQIVPTGEDRVDAAAAIAALGSMGLNRIVCEGGPGLLGQLAAANLVDELCLTVSPLLSGGSYDGRPVPRILDGAKLPDAPRPMKLNLVIEDAGTLFLRYSSV